jgi:RNA polymerase sigma factor (sigma-70 family)
VKPILYSYDINHILHWENAFKDIGYETLYDDTALKQVQGSIVVLAYDEKLLSVVNGLFQNNKVLVLDNTPSLVKAKQMFANGARGYGNTLMAQLYMHSAFETIKNDNIWFTPTLTKELIQSMGTKTDTDAMQEVLQNLTTKEQEIALLLKEGLYNQEIAKKLGVSINTVKSHIKNIYAKVGVKDKLSFIRMMGSWNF